MERSKISIIYIWFENQSYLPATIIHSLNEKSNDIYKIITIKIIWLSYEEEVTEL